MLQLLFPHWRKQNKWGNEYVWVGAAVIAFVVALFFQALGPEQMGAIALIVYFPLSFTATFLVNRFFANSIAGTFRVSIQELEHELRLLLKERSILSNRKVEENGYIYQFVGYDLTMSVQPYVMFHGSKKRSFATTVSFYQLRKSNEALVKALTAAIDETVKQIQSK